MSFKTSEGISSNPAIKAYGGIEGQEEVELAEMDLLILELVCYVFLNLLSMRIKKTEKI